MIDIIGTIKLNSTGLRVEFDSDFNRYYIWLITNYYYNTIKLDAPKHSGHLSIITKKLHKDKFIPNYLQQYHGQLVELQYNPTDLRTGGNNFTNFWFPVEFKLGTVIKKALGIIENNFLGYHITICNNKNYVNHDLVNNIVN